MTQEIKERLEQAAESARLPGKPWTVLTGDKKSAFMLAAKTIIENPREWGLVTEEDCKFYKDQKDKVRNYWISKTDEAQAQLAEYREALERIAMCDFDTKRISFHTIAKEALKQQDNEADNTRD